MPELGRGVGGVPGTQEQLAPHGGQPVVARQGGVESVKQAESCARAFGLADGDRPGQPDHRRAGHLLESPDFALHPQAWAVGNVEVEIGPILKTGDEVVDDFNQLVMDAFNLASGNLLLPGNLLTWNVWFTEPALVDRQEWRDHAEKWRTSIDADHGSPDGPGTSARYFDGRPFEPDDALIEEEINTIIDYLKKHLPHL